MPVLGLRDGVSVCFYFYGGYRWLRLGQEMAQLSNQKI